MRIDKLTSMTTARLMTINEESPLRTAALALSAPGIGLVVVCNSRGTTVGVLSKSDLVRYLAEAPSGIACASALMSKAIIACKPYDDLRTVWQSMVMQSLQNVPILDTMQKPLGVLDIRDAMKTLLEAEELQEHLLANYVAGIGYQ